MKEQLFDMVVIGGGINGTGIARDAAGRGLSVLLCEQHDLAGHTSSASTKLIHGGLRYLEYYEFRLVREALMERERLLGIAPHVIWPLRFVLPHNDQLRPAWMIRTGLFLYDHLGGRGRLPRSRTIDLRRHEAGKALDDRLKRGFIYSDCWVQDARLVVLNAMDAAARGARIDLHTRCERATQKDGVWHVLLRREDGEGEWVQARALVNAAGPWAAALFKNVVEHSSDSGIRLVKGSHIVVRKLFDHDFAYIFQHSDRRIVFAIPYERDYTLIGTTDVDYEGDPSKAHISPEETQYLCDAVSQYFKRPVHPSDVVWSYSGVRPLYDDRAANASAATRDYVLELDDEQGKAPLLSVFGGKLTTYRRLSEHAMEKLQPVMGFTAGPWTADEALPGGDIPNEDFDAYLAGLLGSRAWLPRDLAWRLARDYGTRAEWILGDAASLDDLGECLGADLYEREADYLMEHEWARAADDILWRRSKLGLRFDDDQKRRLDAWLQDRVAAA